VADSEVSLGLNTNVDHTAPVSSTQAVHGRTSAGDGEHRQRKRPAAGEEKTPSETVEPEGGQSDSPPPHKIDSLA